MIPYVLPPLAVLAAYLVGAIPFGYLIARWARGIDIRTVGSGNIGATNVGRALGFRFFVFVFLLDMLKGYLPTYAFPRGVAALAGSSPPELAVLVGLATILGHNFPVYLKFRGGKGVATSLGAVLALDWVAGVSSAVGFVVFLLVTRYVSLSSILGGLVFLATHFVRVPRPWDRDQFAMSVVTFGLVVLLIARHRKNLVRIGQGTEPKVSLRKKPPAGYVAWVLVLFLAVVGLAAAYGLSIQAGRRSELALGPYHLTEVARVVTGHQRCERLAFADGGRVLAVTCPRYNRVVLYRVADSDTLEVVRDLELEGRPVAIWTTRDRLFVLERPAGDARHVEPGWFESFDFEGKPAGSRFVAGMYPDDLAVTPDGRHALVLTSGRAEGDSARPAPALDVVALGPGPPRHVGHLAFERPGDDPARLSLSQSGRCAAVSLLGTDQVAAIDLSDREHPRLVGRLDFPESASPYVSAVEQDAILMAVTPEREAILIPWPGSPSPATGCVAGTSPRLSGLVFHDASTHRVLGRLTLRAGSLNLGATRPLGLAYSPERGLLAVANRSGVVHLIAVRRGPEARSALKGLASASTAR